jgi:predicted ABC-type ATPase
MTSQSPPIIVAVAGPNGAGKSTVGPRIIQEHFGILDLVNVDVLAQGLASCAPETAAIMAARIMLERLDDLAARKANFAFETTLAGLSYKQKVQQWAQAGYEFHLIYVHLDSPELAIERVKERVLRGGHHVHPNDVRRRYSRSLKNLFKNYIPLVKSWLVVDNSVDPLTVAKYDKAGGITIYVPDLWDRILTKGEYDSTN